MRFGVRLPASFESAGEFLADCQAYESAGAELLVLAAGTLNPWLLAAAMAAATQQIGLAAPGDGPELETLRELARGRLVIDPAASGWIHADFPASREIWVQMRTEHEEAGTQGLVLPHDARLIDLLRNPDVEIDRIDLQLAQG